MPTSRARAAAAARALRKHKAEVDHAIECLEAYTAQHQRVQSLIPKDKLLCMIALAWRNVTSHSDSHAPRPAA